MFTRLAIGPNILKNPNNQQFHDQWGMSGEELDWIFLDPDYYTLDKRVSYTYLKQKLGPEAVLPKYRGAIEKWDMRDINRVGIGAWISSRRNWDDLK